ncbi:glycosyltransferase family 4 protein [Streptomyces sp. NPDC088387]|uniref:glycosyltransferase family 4 protein n=1 Tax=Streptomyces sp. NPDC088387 TaxID=3365859 RepID=UPI0037F76E2C
MRILVVTVVHHPEDARILHRQIAALRERGHRILYAAPFAARGVVPHPDVVGIDLPRACGRDRRTALRAARALLAGHGAEADVVLLHDPELLLALPGTLRRWRRDGRAPVAVWDVHEDTAAALVMKRWVPALLRPPLKVVVRAAEHLAERHVRLLLAEHAYQERFRRAHPVVPNFPAVPADPPPAPGTDRVVYLGHLSRARGALDLIETARLVGPDVRVEVIGAADPEVKGVLAEADRAGVLRWHGYQPNDRALELIRGALAGLSLLHDQPNYRHSRPTKVVEYMAHGVPVVTTPTPLAAGLVARHRCGLLVPYENPAATAAAIWRLRTDERLRLTSAAHGRAAALAELDWAEQASDFADRLEMWVKEATSDGTTRPRPAMTGPIRG